MLINVQCRKIIYNIPMATTQTPLKKSIQEFLEYLEIEKNRSLLTVRNYNFYLHRFAGWASQNAGITKPEQITLESVRQYRLWLNRLKIKPVGGLNQAELKKSTQNYHLISIRSFLKYLARRDIKCLSPEKIELAKMPTRQVEFLEGSDLERLLEAPLKVLVKTKAGSDKASPSMDRSMNTTTQNIISKRDKAILELLFSTGLRVSELTGLNRDQMNFEKEEFTVRGKGGKLRLVFVSNQARNSVREYLKMRKDVSPALFTNHDRASVKRDGAKDAPDEARLTSRSVQRLVKKYARDAGITRKITVHTLRHSFATDLLQNGADIRSVQELLGHASLTTTQIYTHLTDNKLREIHEKFHNKKNEK